MPETMTCLTNAPAAFDYDYVERTPGAFDHPRYGLLDSVTMPAASYEYQTNRYLSARYLVIREA